MAQIRAEQLQLETSPQDNLQGKGWTAGIKAQTELIFSYSSKHLKKEEHLNISPNEHARQEERGTKLHQSTRGKLTEHLFLPPFLNNA